MALVSSSVKPLAMRSITVAGRLPVRNSVMAGVICAAARPAPRGTGGAAPGVAGGQPLQDDARGGGSAAEAILLTATVTAAAKGQIKSQIKIRMWIMDPLAFHAANNPAGTQVRRFADRDSSADR